MSAKFRKASTAASQTELVTCSNIGDVKGEQSVA